MGILSESKFHGEEEIIKIRPIVAELYVKNYFPIVNANPYSRLLTAVGRT